MSHSFHNLYKHDFARVAVGVPRCRVADPLFNAAQTIELAEEAGIWASRRRTWPVRSSEEILELFENSGFKVDRLSCSPVRSTRSGLSGPSTLGGADYAQIVATRL